MLAPLDIIIMTTVDSYHGSDLSSARHWQNRLGRIHERAVAALPVLVFVAVAGAVLCVRIWLYLPALPR